MRVPLAVGLKTTDAEQLLPATSVEAHVFLETLKSPALVPEMATLLKVMVDDMEFVIRTDCAEVVDPMAVEANEREAGFGERLLATTPRPVRGTDCGLFVAESVNWRVAERLPVVVGVKTMVAVQLADAASEVPQVFEVIWKSAGFVPTIAILLMVMAAVCVLVSVIAFCPPRPPTGTKFQFSEVGLTVAEAKQMAD